MHKPDTTLLKSLPQIEQVLGCPCMASLQDVLPHKTLADAARAEVNEARELILTGEQPDIELESIAQRAASRALTLMEPSLKRVINASGVIIHTNLGRSVLAPEAKDAVDQVIDGYSTLEYSVKTMSRGSRHDHCEPLICAITGAEAAMAVNNNAAAVLLVLSEFASGHEAIVSRGELVEIGGSFRIPEIMELSRAHMREVGTTNKTHVGDYQRALNQKTSMLLKVHPSNYRVIGFTEGVDIAALRELADAENAARNANELAVADNANAQTAAGDTTSRVLLYEDQGSGAFERLDCFGEYAEPTVAQSLKEGADLVSFSGDKLLGGPQAGVIVGAKVLIDRLKANPLARAVRLDKMTLAALEATLRLYLQPGGAQKSIPTLRMLSEPAEEVRARAEALARAVEMALPAGVAELAVVPEVSRAGGGSLPMCDIPTFALEVTFLKGDAQSCDKYLVQRCAVPIIARVQHETVLCDARTILDGGEIDAIATGLAAYFESI